MNTIDEDAVAHTPDRSATIADASREQSASADPAAHRVETGPAELRRGTLALHRDPPELSWHGLPIPLSPLERELMHLLMLRGRVPWQAIEADIGISAETRDTLVHRIRRKFRALGATDPIETIRHWGLRLRATPHPASTSDPWNTSRPGRDRPHSTGAAS